MGLDMYLTASRYVSREDREATKLTIAGEEIEVVSNRGDDHSWREIGDLTELRFDAGYWRKANAIHRWFVEHVQDGNDDCGTYYVTREKLEELLRTVNAVLNASELVDGKRFAGKQIEGDKLVTTFEDGKTIDDPTLAEQLLPCQDGFFFGSVEYDQWYYDDLELTKSILEQALKAPGNLEFYYRSSW